MAQRIESLTITADRSGDRLDVFLAEHFDGYTRSYWTNMIHHGYVKHNHRIVKPGVVLKQADVVEIEWPEVTRAFAGQVKVIHESNDVIIISKPAGMLVHSKGQFNPEYTVSDFALEHGAQSDGDRPGIVHRLDRQTSGVMVLAKNRTTLQFLQRQFADRCVKKFYIAIVEGIPTDTEVMLDLPLARNPRSPKTFRVDASGKKAQTHVRVIERLSDMAVVLLTPTTGRTHQIRAHLSHIGHPIVGDSQYGSTVHVSNSRFLLHAFALCLYLPGKSQLQKYFAPIPDDMTSYLHAGIIASIDQSILSATD